MRSSPIFPYCCSYLSLARSLTFSLWGGKKFATKKHQNQFSPDDNDHNFQATVQLCLHQCNCILSHTYLYDEFKSLGDTTQCYCLLSHQNKFEVSKVMSMTTTYERFYRCGGYVVTKDIKLKSLIKHVLRIPHVRKNIVSIKYLSDALPELPKSLLQRSIIDGLKTQNLYRL